MSSQAGAGVVVVQPRVPARPAVVDQARGLLAAENSALNFN